MSPRFFRLCAPLCLLLACCTNEVSPYTTSTWDYVFGHQRLQDYLAQRRQVLAGLQGRVEELDMKLMGLNAQMSGRRKELEAAARAEGLSAAARQRAEERTRQATQRSDALYGRLLDAEQELETLKGAARTAQQNQDADRQKIRVLESEIRQIGRDTEALEGVLENSATLKAEQSLRR